MNLLKKIAVMAATGFGLGCSRFAPGTVGSIWGVLLVFVINSHFAVPAQILIAAVLSLIAIPICDVAEKQIGEKDPHCIVADEYLTFPICMIGLPLNPWLLAVAFCSNRFFDIVKFPPARKLQDLHGGLGITIDDVFASLYSLAANHLAWWVMVRFSGLGA